MLLTYLLTDIAR